ncbi:MAG: RSP_2648 family PIN domain-containing protein [Paracoccaceae bacterium]
MAAISLKALLDANVLFPTVMREILLGVAKTGRYQPQWSARILDEWLHAAGKAGAAHRVAAQGEVALLNARWRDAAVAPDPALELSLYLPDPGDRHVLAAAISGACDLIVTQNLKDFPRKLLAEHSLTAIHPDAFLSDILRRFPDDVLPVVDAVRAQAETLSGQPWPLRTLMKKARLPRLGKALDDLV